MLLFLCGFVLLPGLLKGECVIESQRCDFPFQREDETFYGCAEDENSHSYYCATQLGEKYVTGICNGGCFEDDGSPSFFNTSMGDDVLAIFCKTRASPCVFPFTWENQEYSACTTDGNTDFPWCALEVDDQGVLLNNRWGKCDMATCDTTSATTESEVVPPASMKVYFSEYSGELDLEQAGPDEQLELSASFTDLPQDKDLVLAVVDASCDEPFVDHIDSVITLGSLDSSKMSASTLSLSLYSGQQAIQGRSVVVKEKDTPLLNEEGTLEVGSVVACVPVTASAPLDTTIIIIIVLVAVIALLIIILICVCCCCCRRKKHSPVKTTDSDSIDSYRSGHSTTKVPMYDELSIPFIDASLPPTPKVGRSRDQLAILLGRGSKSSLSNEEA